MTKLLHLDSGIQGEKSASRIVSAAIVAKLRAGDASVNVVERDLVAAPIDHLTLPSFGEDSSKRILQEFLKADIVVIGASMYNFTIPSQLKAWIDRILVAGQTFRYGPDGPVGLAGNKRVVVALARGGIYEIGTPGGSFEHAETYLRSIFSFIGIDDPEFVIAEGTAHGEDARKAAIDAAVTKAETLQATHRAA